MLPQALAQARAAAEILSRQTLSFGVLAGWRLRVFGFGGFRV